MRKSMKKERPGGQNSEELAMKSKCKGLNCLVLFCGNLTGAGGAERLILEEEKFFREKGIETTVLTFSFDESALFNYKPERLEMVKASDSHLSKVLALHHRLRQIKSDLVITSYNSIYLYLATLFTRIPYITHIHGNLFWSLGDTLKYALIFKRVFSEIRQSVAGHKEFIPLHPACSFKKRVASEFLAILNWLAVRKARKIIVLTDQVKWEVKKLYGRDSIVARGCLPPEVLSYKPNQNMRNKLGLEGKKIILSIGRLDPRKRIDVLIEAFARILPKYNDLYLLVGGIGEDKERLERLVEKLGIIERVKFIGFIPDSELFDYYAACDVFAFPSWTTSGITPYEALAVGKKVVWTTEADEPILKDRHVFLADPTVKDFSRGLEEALNTHIEGKVNLSDYTWNRYFETVYSAAQSIYASKKS